jgi:prevent-host-death family protein
MLARHSDHAGLDRLRGPGRALDDRLRQGSAVVCREPVDYVVNVTRFWAPMDQPISAAAANRSFSQILREVRAGHSYVVTAHGKPVARIIPCHEADAARTAARAALLQRLAGQPVTDVGPWRRDELYER